MATVDGVRVVHVVPHTHWDREWYAPFQHFRLKLVDLLDDLIPRLERGDAGPHFMLDGQVAAVDDYLELRPEMTDRLAELVRAGTLAIGPWFVLPDEFLVSAETLVRNLQHGLRRGAQLGGTMPVGYLPDMFGHIAQMPQILRLAGFTNAVVWRGVPSSVSRTFFRWAAPDGSCVDAEYLPEGYGNGAFLPSHVDGLVEAVRTFLARHGPMIEGPVLWMNGTDHQLPASHLTSVLTAANRSSTEFEFRIVTLADHLAATRAAPADAHDLTHVGEMRSGARANLLMGVASNRVDVRLAAASAEIALERSVEPMYSLFTPDAPWPVRELDIAWLEVIRNAAHDSVCACSADEVVHTVLNRYAEARQIADTLVERSLYWFGCSFRHAGVAMCNTVNRPRRALVEVTDEQGQPTLTSCEIPPLGWSLVTTAEPPDPAEVVHVGSDGLSLHHGDIHIEIDPTTGTFAVDGHGGLGQLVDDGDIGDTYNWCPPDDAATIDEPVAVAVRVLDASVVRAQIAIDRTYELPTSAVDGRRVGCRTGTIRTIVELRAGEPFVRVTVELDNVWRDHRLRMVMMLPNAADRSEAECAFAVVERGLVAEGGPTELPLPTYPARRFVRAGGLTVAHDAVTEYELIDIRHGSGGQPHAHALALTILRATGMLSRGPMHTRPEPAGPELPLDGPQLLAPIRRRFAIQLGDADAYALADAFTPFPAVRTPGGGHREDRGTALVVHGAEVSSVHRDGDSLVVRVFNPTGAPSALAIPGARGRQLDLRGETVGNFADSLELAPWQIVTLALRDW